MTRGPSSRFQFVSLGDIERLRAGFPTGLTSKARSRGGRVREHGVRVTPHGREEARALIQGRPPAPATPRFVGSEAVVLRVLPSTTGRSIAHHRRSRIVHRAEGLGSTSPRCARARCAVRPRQLKLQSPLRGELGIVPLHTCRAQAQDIRPLELCDKVGWPATSRGGEPCRPSASRMPTSLSFATHAPSGRQSIDVNKHSGLRRRGEGRPTYDQQTIGDTTRLPSSVNDLARP